MIGVDPFVLDRVVMVGGVAVAKPEILQRQWPLLVQYGGIFVLNEIQEIAHDFCVVEDHLTFNRVRDWTVGGGVFDPQALYDGYLRRYTTQNATVNQTLPNVIQTGTTYRVTVSGQGTVGFDGSGGFSWGDNSTGNSYDFDNNSQTITFSNIPTRMFVTLKSNSAEMYQVSLSGDEQAKQDFEHIENNNFSLSDEYLYDIQTWYDESPQDVSTDTLGWLQGYNSDQLFTVFE